MINGWQLLASFYQTQKQEKLGKDVASHKGMIGINTVKQCIPYIKIRIFNVIEDIFVKLNEQRSQI